MTVQDWVDRISSTVVFDRMAIFREYLDGRCMSRSDDVHVLAAVHGACEHWLGASVTTISDAICNLMDDVKHLENRTIADGMNEAGIRTARGAYVEPTHISNVRKVIGMRRGDRYEKPTYKGRNHITG